jgi:hypothetical protein
MASPYPVQQALVCLAQQSKAEREALTQPADPVVEGGEVVADLAHVVVEFADALLVAGLEPKQVDHIGLGALDPRTEHRFQSDIRGDQEMGVREEPADPAQPVEGAGCLLQQQNQVAGVLDVSREWCREERPVLAVGDASDDATTAGGEIFRSHPRNMLRAVTVCQREERIALIRSGTYANALSFGC